MSEHLEIRRLITEQAGSDEERKELLQTARRLEVTLARDVEVRPGFQGDLRRRLLAEYAREQSEEQGTGQAVETKGKVVSLWRKASTWGWTLGAVAAALMVAKLSYGYGQDSRLGPDLKNPAIVGEPNPTAVPPVALPNATQPVSVVNLPDVLGAPVEYMAGLKGTDRVGQVDYQLATVLPALPSQAELLVYKLEGVPLTGPELVAYAQRAGFAKAQAADHMLRVGEATRAGTTPDYTTGTGRWLDVDATGLLTYIDDQGQSLEQGQRKVATAEAAEAAARKFLGQLQIVVPGGEPVVSEGQFEQDTHAWRVEWTVREPAPGMPGGTLPLIGHPVSVIVADNGVIARAGAQLGRLESKGLQKLKSPEEAYSEMRANPVAGKVKHLSITVQQVDLVYGRPQAGGASPVYAMPYYRFIGTTDQGWPITRYVPAVEL